MPRTLGDFEVLILLAIVRLGERAYGANIHQEIEERGRRSVAIGAVYTGLARLVKSGYLEASIGDPTPQRGGRRKKFYRLRPAGAEALTQSVETHRRMIQGIESELDDLLPFTGGGRGS
jgi:DNA-binding PadR family transcriptional regulator